MIKFSVLIPTYNRADLLKRALQSLLDQPYKEIEVIVVDDGSTDHTKDIVDLFKEQFQQFVYHKNDKNMGETYSDVKASELATGDYLFTYSDDDLIVDKCFDTVAKVIENEGEYDMIYTDLSIIDNNDQQISVWTYQKYNNKYNLMRDMLLAGSNLIPEGLFLKRIYYQKIYYEIYYKRNIYPFFLCDLDFISFRYIPEALRYYRLHNSNTASSFVGIMERNKGVANWINNMLYMYPVDKIFNIHSNNKLEKIKQSLIMINGIFTRQYNIYLNNHFVDHTLEYQYKDKLWTMFYLYNNLWGKNYNKLFNDNLYPYQYANVNISDEQLLTFAQLDSTYIHMPLFSNIHRNVSNVDNKLVAYDIISLSDHFTEGVYPIENIDIVNWNANDIKDVEMILDNYAIRVIVSDNYKNSKIISEMLYEKGKYFVNLINTDHKPLPKQYCIPNIFNWKVDNIYELNKRLADEWRFTLCL